MKKELAQTATDVMRRLISGFSADLAEEFGTPSDGHVYEEWEPRLIVEIKKCRPALKLHGLTSNEAQLIIDKTLALLQRVQKKRMDYGSDTAKP